MFFSFLHTGSLFPYDPWRGPAPQLPQAGSASLDLHPGPAGGTDQDERQRAHLLHLPYRHAQTDQE